MVRVKFAKEFIKDASISVLIVKNDKNVITRRNKDYLKYLHQMILQ